MNNSKPWYLSKTIWANIVAAIGLIINSQAPMVSGEELAAFVVVINLILRMFTHVGITKDNSSNAVPAIALMCLLGLLMQGCGTPSGYDAQMHPYRPEYIAVQAAPVPAAEAAPQREIDTSKWAENQPRADANPVRSGREAVQIRANESGASIGIDLLGIRNYQAGPWARSAWGPLKLVTYPLDYIGYMATNHPFQSIAIGLAAWEIADNGVSDIIDDAFGGGGSSGNSPPKAEPTPTTNNGVVTQIKGNNNVIINQFNPLPPAPVATPAATPEPVTP